MKHESLAPKSTRTLMTRALVSFLVIIAITMLLAEAGIGQGSNHDAVVNELNNLAEKAQMYYKIQGNSLFAAFALEAIDTGTADGSYSIYYGSAPPIGANYVPSSTAAAGTASGQTLYTVGCGKDQYEDGTNPIKVFATVTVDSKTTTDPN